MGECFSVDHPLLLKYNLQPFKMCLCCFGIQIKIEGVVGGSYTGDLAIDDISFTKGSCRGEKFAFLSDNSTDTKGD